MELPEPDGGGAGDEEPEGVRVAPTEVLPWLVESEEFPDVVVKRVGIFVGEVPMIGFDEDTPVPVGLGLLLLLLLKSRFT